MIKHPAPRSAGHKADLYISSKSPFISTVKKIDKLHKLLERQHRQHVSVYATGKAVERALSVGLNFQQLGHKVEILTSTLNVLDEHDDGDEDNEPEFKKRSISRIEVKIFRR